MGLLTLAGALSGAGKGLEEGLGKTQTWAAWQQLEKNRSELEASRQDKQLAATQRMHAEDIQSRASEGKLSREHAEKLQSLHAESIGKEKAAERLSHETIAREGHTTQKEIAEINNRSVKGAHEADRALKEWQLEQSKEAADLRNNFVEATKSGDKAAIKAAKSAYTAYAEKPWESEKIDLTSAVNGMRETGTEITRLSVALKDPMIDRKGADYAAMSRQLDNATAAHAAFVARVQDLSGSGTPERGEITTEMWSRFVEQNPGKPANVLKAAAEKMGYTFPKSFSFETPKKGGLIQDVPSAPGALRRAPGIPPGPMGR